MLLLQDDFEARKTQMQISLQTDRQAKDPVFAYSRPFFQRRKINLLTWKTKQNKRKHAFMCFIFFSNLNTL